MKRRKINAETKMAEVLEGLRSESSIADICRKYQISESLYYRWRDKFLEGGSDLPPVVVPSFKLEWRSSQARDPGGA